MVRIQAPQVVLVNLAAGLVAVGGFEAYLWLTRPAAEPELSEVHYGIDYYDDNPILGYGPRKGIHTVATKRYRDEVVYQATYTIDADGLRLTPSAPGASTSLLFFGGSITFGEGLDDRISMPYRVGERYGNLLRVYNFGFHGYGPHQMLAALEQGLVETVVAEPVSAVVYQAIPAHVARAAGRAPWDRHGPWYRLDDTGRVQFAGRFDERVGSKFAAVLERSLTYQRIFGLERRISDEDIALFVAIVDSAREQCAQRFPGSRFFVILWGYEDDPLYERLSAALATLEMAVHPISSILPHYADDPLRYQISPHDRHPNALAQDLIAEYVVEHVIGPIPDPSR